MKKLLLLLILIINCGLITQAQIYIDQSHTYEKGPSSAWTNSKIVGDYVYFIGTTRNSTFPITNSYTRAQLNITGINNWTYYKKVNKYTGQVMASSLIGAAMTYFPTFEVVGNKVYVGGAVQESFTAPNQTITPAARDMVYWEIDEATGDILYVTNIGGSANDGITHLRVEGDMIILGGSTKSADFTPITDTTLKSAGAPIADHMALLILNRITHNVEFSAILGDGGYSVFMEAFVDDNKLYLPIFSYSLDNLVEINGNNVMNSPADDYYGLHLAALDLTTFTWDYSTNVLQAFDPKDAGLPQIQSIKQDANYIHSVATYLGDVITATNGTITDGYYDGLYLKIDKSTGSVVASSAITGYDEEYFNSLVLDGTDVFLCGGTTSSDVPVTDGSSHSGGSNYDVLYAQLDGTNADILKLGYLGQKDADGDVQLIVDDKYMHITGTCDDMTIVNGRPTRNTTKRELSYVRKEKSTGSTVYAGFVGDGNITNGNEPQRIYSDNGDVYLTGLTGLNQHEFPITTPGLPSSYANRNLFYMRLSLPCDISLTLTDTVSPASQTICQNGIPAVIDALPLTLSGDSLPLIYRNMAPEAQDDITLSYQWQDASSPTGPWSNISAGVLEDYQPSIGATTQYFRRLAYVRVCGDSNVVSTSSVATINTNSMVAPMPDAGNPLTSCPGVTFTLGGSPAATGGTPPYQYAWYAGSATTPFDTTANPSTSAASSTIYTLEVTDANGCIQIDQGTANIVNLDAGPDRSVCDGDSVTILAQGATGLAGTTYSWLPTTGLDCPSCLQPKVSINGVQDYAVSMTIPVTGGGTCTLMDSITISASPAPTTSNFAGPDRVICFPGTAQLGTPAEAGYTYTWAPGNYLSTNSASTTTYNPGSLIFPPVPDSAIYYLTAESNGCTYFDTVVVAVIRAHAGEDGCGPRTLGKDTDVPTLNETFIWTKISGSGNFIGPTNIPYPVVSASPGAATTYQLQTVYKGDTCTDNVVVGPCGGCGVDILVSGEIGCPNANLGDIALNAISTFGSDVTWDWSPKVGLSSYNTSTVYLTDLTPRTYTVTARSTLDTTESCFDTILVNAPSMTLPIFNVVDTSICTGDTINIGAPVVSGYSYEWTPGSNLSGTTVANPLAYGLQESTDYEVTITDIGTGCKTVETAHIVVANPKADAGPDWFICDNATIQLGVPAVAGQQYTWSPQAPWQNGTDSTSAQAQPLVAASLDFYLQVVDSASGCVSHDTVAVTVNNIPTLPGFPDATACLDNSISIGGAALPGVVYSWTPTTGLANPNASQTLATPTSSTNYILTATFPGNCTGTAVDTVVVTVDSFSFMLTDTTYCPSGGAFALGSGVPTGMTSYSWAPPNLVSNASIANPNTAGALSSTESSYTVTVTNPNGCVDTAVRKIIPSAVKPDAGSSKSICINETTTLGDVANSGGAGISYAWSPTTDLSCTTCGQPTFTPTAVGTFNYTITRTDSNLSCSSTDEVTVVVNGLPLTALAQPSQICQNSSVQIGTSQAAGVTYSWSPTTNLSDWTISNPIASPTVSTVYTLTAVSGLGCVSQEQVAVGVSPIPAPTVDAQAVTICQTAGGGVMNASATPTGTYSYLWSPATGLNDVSLLNPSFIAGNLGETVYTLSVTDVNTGCQGSDTALITIEPCLASIGNYVWNDVNEDGIQDTSETGVAGVTVYLLNSFGLIIDSTVTTNTGFYEFTDLVPTTYGIRFDLNSLPANHIVTSMDAGSDDELDSDGDPVTGQTSFVTLVENENNTSFDLGIHMFVPNPNTLGDVVWNDLNQDGIQDANEVGVAGVTVTLYDNTGNVIGTTVTDAYGNYLFTDLPAGNYTVGFTLPPNYVFSPQDAGTNDSTDSDVDPLTGKTLTYTLGDGSTNLTADAGIYFEEPTMPTSIGDYVWYDTDMDGIQDSTEVGIGGVTVTLYDNAGNPVATTVTDGAGMYLFTDVPPGTYTVGVTPPAGLGFSPNNGGITDSSNSDINPSTGQSTSFTVNAGDQVTSVDAGLSPLPTTVGSLGDRVWYDENQDGIQDAGEVGASGVTVTLYDSTGTNVIATTTTDGFGNYVFNNLPAGKYVVGFTTPAGFTISPQGAGSDTTLNSDAVPATGKTAVITLGQGEHNPTIDAGIFNSTPANNNSIGDYVWHDENQDGIQDGTEEGVSGITVTLYDNAGTPITTTTTDANGYYNFPFLPNGTYSVGFSNLPADNVFSPTGAGTASTDSDADPTGRTSTVSLTGNTHITDLDAGIYEGDMNIGTASLGNKVWNDIDGDGIQDPDELGVAGVTVYLYDSTGTNIIDSTTTDALGNYIFTDLTPDTYYVGFSNTPTGFTFSPQDADSEGTNGATNSDVNPTTGLSNPIVLGAGEDNLNVDVGLVPPTGTAGLGDKVWIDLNQDGLQDANEPGISGVQVSLLDENGNVVAVTTTDENGNYQFIGLTPGDYQVQFSNLPNGYTFTTQDADNAGLGGTTNSDADSSTGITPIITLAANQYNPNIDAGISSTTVGSVGDYVWHDENGDGIQDPNEAGIGGVLVTLYDNAGNPVASTLTKEDGSYLFPNVTPGTYTLGFDNLPSGMTFSPQDAGTNDSTDSDVNPSTGRTSTFTVTGGGHNSTIDAGLTAPLPAGLGNYVWHDFNEDGVQDAGEPPVAGVLVTLYASDGTTVLAQAVTNGAGYYEFKDLDPGDYIIGFSNLPDESTPTQSTGSLNTASNSDMNPTTLKTATVTLTAGEFNPNVDGGIYFGVPLPVSLTSFKATEENCNGILRWTTSREENTKQFDILRSEGGSTIYEKIGEQAAKGNSNIEQEYVYTDNNLNGTYHYKLRIIDYDLQMNYSNTVSIIVDCTTKGLIKLYPNPVEDNLQVLSQLDEADFYQVKLYDMTGRVLYETRREVQKENDVFEVPMSSLANGSYLLEITGENIGKQEFKVQKK